MITKITPSNAARYTALFDKAERALNKDVVNEEDKVVIETLDDYFRVMANLHSISREYTILPLDEETFDIDANTRTIKVPDAFKKYGIGVQGDQAAEIVFFTVDRYFDHTDLNEQDIYIEWETSGKKSKKGLSHEYVRDITSKPGKLIFGWPITSIMTEESGPITFSVRFYKTKLKENSVSNYDIIYSLATTSTTVNINKSMNFTITDDSIEKYGEEHYSFINTRIRNSTGESTGVKPEEPILFVLDLENLNVVDNWGKGQEFDLIKSENGFAKTFAAQAYNTDAGVLSYEWQYTDDLTDENKNWSPEDPSKFSDVYVKLTADPEGTDTEKLVYYTIDNETGEYILTPTYLPDKTYVKHSEFVATRAGYYKVKVGNRIKLNTTYKDSEYFVVPLPEMPVIVEQYPENTEYISVLMDDNNEAILNITLNKEPEGTAENTFVWKTEAGDAIGISSTDTSTSSIQKVTESGYYFVGVQQSRNGSSMPIYEEIFDKNPTSNVRKFRVTHSPKTVEFITPAFGSSQKVELGSGSISATWNLIEESDELEVKLYKYDFGNVIPEKDDKDYVITDEDITLVEIASETLEGDATNVAFDISSIEFPVDTLKTGLYTITIVNKLNGASTEATQSGNFRVQDDI